MKVGEFARRAVRPGCPRRLSSKLHLKERAAICVCSMRRLHCRRRPSWVLRRDVRLSGPFSQSPGQTKHLVRKKPDRQG